MGDLLLRRTRISALAVVVTNQYEDWDLGKFLRAGRPPSSLALVVASKQSWAIPISRSTVTQLVAHHFRVRPAKHALFGAVNAYVDADLGQWRPFAGIGLGVAEVDFDRHGVSVPGIVMNDRRNAMLWQVSGGVGYDLSENLTLEGIVRYQSIMDVDLTSTPAGGSLGS